MKMRFMVCVLFISLAAVGQEKSSVDFNMGFEKVVKGQPVGWTTFGSDAYSISLDSGIAHEGKYSARIALGGITPEFKAWAFTIPGSYPGEKITLSGYIKTEGVTQGYAGLWMRIDPAIAFDNMNRNGITGTTNWKKYEVTLDMKPNQTKQIVFGGLLAGNGKMWLDNLQVTIDGKEIEKLSPLVKTLLPAEKDHEFDSGSRISIQSVNQVQADNLNRLGLIWGFLKYYHPAIARGELNWDYALFRVLPGVLSASDRKAADNVVLEWVRAIGSCQQGASPIKADSIKLQPDLEWMKSSGIGLPLAEELEKIRQCARTGEHFYVGFQPAGNPDFRNENSYESMKYPDAGFRLLALFRYWSVIHYYFPYKSLIGEDWKGVLKEFIPKVVKAEDETAYTLVMLELIARVHDTHANIWGGNPVLNKYYGQFTGPVQVDFVQEEAVVTGYHDEALGKEAGLEPGDLITGINGRPVKEIVRDRLKYTPASNYPTQLRDIAAKLLRTNEPTLAVTAKRGSRTFSCTLKSTSTTGLKNRFQPNDTSFRLVRKDIAYINNSSLRRSHLEKIWPAVKDTKGLILDLRNYPSDFPIYDVCDYLLPKEISFVKFTQGSIVNPGQFTFGGMLQVGKGNGEGYKGKVIILVNELSQSSAEFHAMAYRVHPRATVVGSTTAGADGNVSQFYLPGGISTMISGIGVYYPDGGETQRVGIVPDVMAKPTIEGIRKGRDELMEKAIELIDLESKAVQKK